MLTRKTKKDISKFKNSQKRCLSLYGHGATYAQTELKQPDPEFIPLKLSLYGLNGAAYAHVVRAAYAQLLHFQPGRIRLSLSGHLSLYGQFPGVAAKCMQNAMQIHGKPMERKQ